MDSVHTLYSEGRFLEAQTIYSKIVESDPTNVVALERLGNIALWENKLETAERYFKLAIEHLSKLQKFWPFSAQLKTRLAMVYYRSDQFVAASQLFKEAAGPIAVGPFRQLGALSNWLNSWGAEQPYTLNGPGETRLEFVVTDPLPVVKVSFGNGMPVCCLIDTGGSEIILDTQLAKEVGARVATTMIGEFAGAKKATLGLGRVDTIRLGEFIVRNVPVHTLHLASISPLFNGLDIKGIIGTRLLMHFLSTIDYRNGLLTLRRATPENLKRLEAEADAHKAKRIPFWLIDTHYIVAEGTVNRIGPLLFWVDTGLAGKGFIPSEAVLRKAGIVVDWSKAEKGVGGGGSFKETPIILNELTLGTGSNEVMKHDIVGVVMERQPVLGNQFGFEISGLISHQFFRDRSLTVDFENMRMILQ